MLSDDDPLWPSVSISEALWPTPVNTEESARTSSGSGEREKPFLEKTLAVRKSTGQDGRRYQVPLGLMAMGLSGVRSELPEIIQ